MTSESKFLSSRHERLNLKFKSLRVEEKFAQRVVGGHGRVGALDIAKMPTVVDRQLKGVPAMRNHIGGFEARVQKSSGLSLRRRPGTGDFPEERAADRPIRR
jgi:hypothetical protein